MGDRQLFVKVRLTEDEYQMLMKLAHERGISAPFTLLEEGMPKVVQKLVAPTPSPYQDVTPWPERALEVLRLAQAVVNESEPNGGPGGMIVDVCLFAELKTLVQKISDEAWAKIQSAAREQVG